jgi:hypothetical protein
VLAQRGAFVGLVLAVLGLVCPVSWFREERRENKLWVLTWVVIGGIGSPCPVVRLVPGPLLVEGGSRSVSA